MRVNQANSSPIQSTDTSAAGGAKKSEKSKASPYDSKVSDDSAKSGSTKTEISSRAHEMAQAKQIATDAPDVREAKIAELKAKIQNKKYDVSADAIADRMVDDHLHMAGA